MQTSGHVCEDVPLSAPFDHVLRATSERHPLWNDLDRQVIYTSLELAREVQRITVDASANVSEVQLVTLASIDSSSMSGLFALRHGYYISPWVPFNATADQVTFSLTRCRVYVENSRK